MAKATSATRPPQAGARKPRGGTKVATRACPLANGGARATPVSTAPVGPGAELELVSNGRKRKQCEGVESVPRQPRAHTAPVAVARPAAAPVPDVVNPLLRDLQAVVINLERRPDRMQGCAKRLTTHCPWLRFSRFVATDGKANPIGEAEVSTSWHTARNVVYQRMRAVRKGWIDLDTYKERHLAMSPGERGCASSHIRAWRRCLELAGDSQRPLLVLEDDAAPTAEFTQLLVRALAALPPDAGLLYLGYSQAADWRRAISPELAEAEYVWTTVGYLVWPAGARLLLSRLPVNEPVDNWLAGLCAEGNIKAYCVRPKIVLQADAWNVNSDVAHSDEHYWGPNSDIHHSDAFYWGPVAGADAASQPPAAISGGPSLFGVDSSDSDSDGDN